MRTFARIAGLTIASGLMALAASGPVAAAPGACQGVKLGRYMVAFHSGPAEPNEPGMPAMMPAAAAPKGMVYRHVEVHVMNPRTCAPVLRRAPALTLFDGGAGAAIHEPLMRMGLGADRHFGMDHLLKKGARYQAVVHLGSGVAFFVPFRVPRAGAAAAM